jgi:hypothetical protein
MELSMFTSQEYAQILTFLQRVDLKGQEANTFVAINQKLANAYQMTQAAEAANQKQKADTGANDEQGDDAAA